MQTTGNGVLDLVLDKHLTPYPKGQCYEISTGVYGPSGAVGMNDFEKKQFDFPRIHCASRNYR